MLPPCVYRFYDVDFQLLYIGRSMHFPSRMRDHLTAKSWVHQVKRIMLEWHETKEAAAVAERAAIVREQPLYNVYRGAKTSRPGEPSVKPKPRPPKPRPSPPLGGSEMFPILVSP